MAVYIFYPKTMYELFDNIDESYLADSQNSTFEIINELVMTHKIIIPKELREDKKYKKMFEYQYNARRGKIIYLDPNKKINIDKETILANAITEKTLDTTMTIDKDQTYLLFAFVFFDYFCENVKHIVDENYDICIFI